MRNRESLMWCLYKWAETILLRADDEHVRTLTTGSHYTIEPEKGTGRQPVGGTKREVIPGSKRPVISASGQQYARCEADPQSGPGEPPPGFWPFMTIEEILSGRPDLRAFAIHRYAHNRRVTEFENGRRLHRELLSLIEDPAEGLSIASRSEVLELISVKDHERDAARKAAARRAKRGS